MKRCVVTGGVGFIGSALCHLLLSDPETEVTVIDRMTYAANPATLESLKTKTGFRHIKADVCDAARMHEIMAGVAPDAVFHLAAETHVDRSIDGPADFISTNLVGTYAMLEAARNYWVGLGGAAGDVFRFVHVSTDEVFGALGAEGVFTETSRYDPSSPYSASKAGADHLARAWQRTYGLPVVVSNCSNNYGPRQFPEKLIPLMILNALEGKPLPVYGNGLNVRDWLHVEDHARALRLMAQRGVPGEVYCVGGGAERTNLQIVQEVCRILDARRPAHAPHEALIEFVEDRPAHDFRYAIDPAKISRELGWSPTQDFEAGLEATVDWYLANEDWWHPERERGYQGQRLGRGR
ncbi:MAG: dTDP-glucose 4,6-dehydratase [Rhodobacterales bacterium]|nr:dTDP-glucose 4,6-dehydratase [Rhodobacterales bacterium]